MCLYRNWHSKINLLLQIFTWVKKVWQLAPDSTLLCLFIWDRVCKWEVYAGRPHSLHVCLNISLGKCYCNANYEIGLWQAVIDRNPPCVHVWGRLLCLAFQCLHAESSYFLLWRLFFISSLDCLDSSFLAWLSASSPAHLGNPAWHRSPVGTTQEHIIQPWLRQISACEWQLRTWGEMNGRVAGRKLAGILMKFEGNSRALQKM